MRPYNIAILVLASIFLTQKAGAQTQEEAEMLQEFSRRLKFSAEKFARKNVLLYGAPCSVETERQRSQLTKRVLEAATSVKPGPNFNVHKFLEDMSTHFGDLAELPGDFCNTYKALECGSDGTCACASLGVTLGFNLKFKREGEACLIADGSICAPNEVLNKKNPMLEAVPPTDYRCSSRTTCVVKGAKGEACTEDNMQAALNPTITAAVKAGTLNMDNLMEFVMKKVKEGVCVCRGSYLSAANLMLVGAALFSLGSMYF